MKKSFLIMLAVMMISVLALSACQPQVIVETVEVEKEVIVEKEVEVVVEKEVEVIVEKEVEVEVPAEIGELRTVRLTHGGSLCNLPLFVSFEHPEWWAREGLSPESVPSPSITEQVAALAGGLVDFTGAPYTSQLALIAQSAGTVKIVTGVGGGGLGLVTHKGMNTPETLLGTKWGLSPSDTLEVQAYVWLKDRGYSYDDIEIIYEAAGVDILGAWTSGNLSVVNCVQPYCDDMVAEFDGEILVEGVDLFGEGYSDCVITASTELMENEPEVVTGLIKVLMLAQKEIEQNQAEALASAYQKWFRVSDISVAERAMEKVFPQIDQRSQEEFIMNGVGFMLEMGYIPADLESEVDSTEDVFDWSFLLEVIDENPELYEELAHK